MKRIGILGNIGSGKSYVAKSFGYPVFDADKEVVELYKKDKKVFYKLNMSKTYYDLVEEIMSKTIQIKEDMNRYKSKEKTKNLDKLNFSEFKKHIYYFGQSKPLK